jgi:hypothetical protein
MKISAKTARKKIKSGTAWIEGKMSTGYRYPEGEEYWILTDGAQETTHHVLVDDDPELDQVKSLPNQTKPNRKRHENETRDYRHNRSNQNP